MTGDKIRILVADDEESVRNLLRRILEEAGYSVVTAADGEEALYEASQHELAAVLLDIKMPRMSGMEALGKLTDDWPDVCVVMITAVVDAQTAIEAMKLGADDYIMKPFNQDELLLKVREAIERRQLQTKNKRLMLEMQRNFKDQSERMQSQFNELVSSLAREHRLLQELAKRDPASGKVLLSKLPPELREPMTSFEEFREALLGILRGGVK